MRNFLRFVNENSHEDTSAGIIRDASFFIRVPRINVLTSHLLILPAVWINGWQIYKICFELTHYVMNEPTKNDTDVNMRCLQYVDMDDNGEDVRDNGLFGKWVINVSNCLKFV